MYGVVQSCLYLEQMYIYIYIYTRMQFFSIHMGLQGKLAIPGTNAMERFLATLL